MSVCYTSSGVRKQLCEWISRTDLLWIIKKDAVEPCSTQLDFKIKWKHKIIISHWVDLELGHTDTLHRYTIINISACSVSVCTRLKCLFFIQAAWVDSWCPDRSGTARCVCVAVRKSNQPPTTHRLSPFTTQKKIKRLNTYHYGMCWRLTRPITHTHTGWVCEIWCLICKNSYMQIHGTDVNLSYCTCVQKATWAGQKLNAYFVKQFCKSKTFFFKLKTWIRIWMYTQYISQKRPP